MSQRFITEAGSIVTVDGGKAAVDFNWFEEPGMCVECRPCPYPLNGKLTWDCDVCGGGSAALLKDDERQPE